MMEFVLHQGGLPWCSAFSRDFTFGCDTTLQTIGHPDFPFSFPLELKQLQGSPQRNFYTEGNRQELQVVTP